MPNNSGVGVKLEMDPAEYRALMATFKIMPKEAQAELRVTNKKLVGVIAEQMKAAAPASSNPKQAVLLARSIRANKDRVPSISVGGARRAPVSRKATTKSPRPTYGELLAAEFGAKQPGPNTFPQGGRKFAPKSGYVKGHPRGYFIFPTLRKAQPEIRREFIKTVELLFKKRW